MLVIQFLVICIEKFCWGSCKEEKGGGHCKLLLNVRHMSGCLFEGADAQGVVLVRLLSSANATAAAMANMEADDIEDIGLARRLNLHIRTTLCLPTGSGTLFLLSLKNADLRIGSSNRNLRKGINSFHCVNIHTFFICPSVDRH